MSTEPYFHVTSSLNRSSIEEHGLDWNRMGSARGIAGSTRPEQEGCFVAREHEAEWFVAMNNTGGPVDVWEVDGVSAGDLCESPEGYSFVPRTIPPDRVRLVRRDIEPRRGRGPERSGAGRRDHDSFDRRTGLFFEL